MENRNPYLVTQALKHFMWGSILAAVSSQLATTTDAIVVSHLIGPDAISAINLMMPVLTVFSCMMILFGIGASIVAAKAIGRRDGDTANGVFTAAVLGSVGSGVALAIVAFIFSPEIAGAVTGGNEQIYLLALSYLRVMCVSVPFMMLGGVIENFVKTDGNPRMVMGAVIAGSSLNLILDIVFIKWLGMGIAGSAWATGLNYMLAIIICLGHFRSPHNSLKWHADWGKMMAYMRQSVIQGLPMSINTLLLGGSILLINYIVLFAQGAEGIYCWSVCLQLFMIMQMVLAGIGSSIFSIGGVLAGERDMEGLAILNRKSLLYTVGSLTVITLVILICPRFFGALFGNKPDHPVLMLPYALRAFSFMLVPYAIVAMLRSTYQILGRTRLSLFLSIVQLLLMVGFVWGFSFISADVMWWGFAASSAALLSGLVLYTAVIQSREKRYRFVTLIPRDENDAVLALSVKMTPESVTDADKEIKDFLGKLGIDAMTAYRVRLDCEELMRNIVKHAVGKRREKHYFDLHISVTERDVQVLIKDDGRPFNPVITDEDRKIDADNPNGKIGLKIINALYDHVNYKYMYDQNMVMLSFSRNN